MRFFLKVFLLLVLIFISYIFIKIFLPDLIEKKLKEVKNKLKVDKLVETKIKSSPSFKTIIKKIENMEIKKEFKKNQIKVKSMKASNFEIEITENDLTEYLKKEKSISDLKIKLDKDKVNVIGGVEILGNNLDLNVEGEFIVLGKSIIKFQGKKIKVANAKLPDFLTQKIFDKVSLQMDLNKAMKTGFSLNIKKIKIKKGTMNILAEIKEKK